MGAFFEYMDGHGWGMGAILLFMGGHGSYIAIHGWAWVGIGHVCVGIGGRGCNLKGKCRILVCMLAKLRSMKR